MANHSETMDSETIRRQLNLDLVHQHSIPSVWNRVKLDTFPENFVVLGFVPGDQFYRRLFVQGIGGSSGLAGALQMFQPDEVQYSGIRVSVLDANNKGYVSPRFILLRWIGKSCNEKQRRHLDEDLQFLKKYFRDAHVFVEAKDIAETLDGEEDPIVIEQNRRLVLEQMVTTALFEVEPTIRDHILDFSNCGSVEECSHYVDPPNLANTDPASSELNDPQIGLTEAMAAAGAAKEGEFPPENGTKVAHDDQVPLGMEGMLSDAEISEGLQNPVVMSVLQGIMTGNFDSSSMIEAMRHPDVHRVLSKLYIKMKDECAYEKKDLQDISSASMYNSSHGRKTSTSSCSSTTVPKQNACNEESSSLDDDTIDKDKYHHAEIGNVEEFKVLMDRLQLSHEVQILKAESAHQEALQASQHRLQRRLAERKARKVDSESLPLPMPPIETTRKKKITPP